MYILSKIVELKATLVPLSVALRTKSKLRNWPRPCLIGHSPSVTLCSNYTGNSFRLLTEPSSFFWPNLSYWEFLACNAITPILIWLPWRYYPKSYLFRVPFCDQCVQKSSHHLHNPLSENLFCSLSNPCYCFLYDIARSFSVLTFFVLFNFASL